MKMEATTGDICTVCFVCLGFFPPQRTVQFICLFKMSPFFGSKTVKEEPLRQIYQNCVSWILNLTYKEKFLFLSQKQMLLMLVVMIYIYHALWNQCTLRSIHDRQFLGSYHPQPTKTIQNPVKNPPRNTTENDHQSSIELCDKLPMNNFSSSAINNRLKAFGHKLRETSYSIFVAFHHFWVGYKVLLHSRVRFHYLSFK